jgi:hypothetical protein
VEFSDGSEFLSADIQKTSKEAGNEIFQMQCAILIDIVYHRLAQRPLFFSIH